MNVFPEELERVAERFRRFAKVEARGYCRFYEELSLRIAQDERLLQLAANVQRGQPVPNVLFAAVQFLILRGVEHDLAEHFARAGREGSSASGTPAWPAFREFCLEHTVSLVPLLVSRRTQTNEIGRSALIYPAVSFVAQGVTGVPVSVIDVGASAGLNLLWDRYRYRYVFESGRSIERGDAESSVLLRCEVRGGRPSLPEEFPTVAQRIGIDLSPIDLRDADDTLWLRSLLWPDRPDRAERMQLAIEAARENPPEVLRGDALQVLPSVIERVPDGVLPCVLNCWTLNQFTPAMRQRLSDVLRGASRVGKIVRISMEGTGDSNVSEIRVFSYVDGEESMTPLARAHPHGHWIEWRPDPGRFSDRVY